MAIVDSCPKCKQPLETDASLGGGITWIEEEPYGRGDSGFTTKTNVVFLVCTWCKRTFEHVHTRVFENSFDDTRTQVSFCRSDKVKIIEHEPTKRQS